MWMFYAMNNGWIPCGNDGMLKVPSRVQSDKALKALAVSWQGNRPGRVYLMRTWTQKMSELGPRAFEEYIMRNGKVIATR